MVLPLFFLKASPMILPAPSVQQVSAMPKTYNSFEPTLAPPLAILQRPPEGLQPAPLWPTTATLSSSIWTPAAVHTLRTSSTNLPRSMSFQSVVELLSVLQVGAAMSSGSTLPASTS